VPELFGRTPPCRSGPRAVGPDQGRDVRDVLPRRGACFSQETTVVQPWTHQLGHNGHLLARQCAKNRSHVAGAHQAGDAATSLAWSKVAEQDEKKMSSFFDPGQASNPRLQRRSGLRRWVYSRPLATCQNDKVRASWDRRKAPTLDSAAGPPRSRATVRAVLFGQKRKMGSRARKRQQVDCRQAVRFDGVVAGSSQNTKVPLG